MGIQKINGKVCVFVGITETACIESEHRAPNCIRELFSYVT
jgi:hypothetical protein